MAWKVYLYDRESGRMSERLTTANASEAEAHFRKLLARDDLAGRKLAAVFESAATGMMNYFSCFDMPFERGRIRPDAPLDPFREDENSIPYTAYFLSHEELQKRYSNTIEAAIAKAKARGEPESDLTADHSTIHAKPHPHGIAWEVMSFFGSTLLRGIRRPGGSDLTVTPGKG